MLNRHNHINSGPSKNATIRDSNIKRFYMNKFKKITEIHNQRSTNVGPDSMDDLNTFFTLLLKSLTPKERIILLHKLLNIDWENPDLESQLKEIIDMKKDDDEEFKKTLNYDYFSWNFNNWKNFFLSDDKK